MKNLISYKHILLSLNLFFISSFKATDTRDMHTQTPPSATLSALVGQAVITTAISYVIAGYLYTYVVKRIQAGYKNVEAIEEFEKLSKQAEYLQAMGCTVTFPVPTLKATRLDGITNEFFDTYIFPFHVAWAHWWVKQGKNDRMLFIF